MRVPFVVMALVAAPFIASNAQGGNRSSRNDNVQQQGQHNDGEKCDKAKKDKGRNGQNDRGQKGHDDCAAPATKPPAPTPPPVGQAEVHGTVFNDTDLDGTMGMFEYGMSGWTVTLSGPVTATVVTDANGAYAFTKLPVGLYTVCQVSLAGWSQTGPKAAVGTACPGGTGWALDVPASMPALWYGSIDFGNAGIAQ
jgi:hypothetical protein